MHEFAITRSMLDHVLVEAGKHNARVTKIILAIGEQAGVVPDSVLFYFDTMKTDTAAAEAELVFKRVPLVLKCPKCGREFGDIEDTCECNAGAEILSGQEMVIESIEIDEPPA